MTRLGYSGEYLLDFKSGHKTACGILRRNEAGGYDIAVIDAEQEPVGA